MNIVSRTRTARIAIEVYADHVTTVNLVSDTVRIPDRFWLVASGLNRFSFAKTAKIFENASVVEAINTSGDWNEFGLRCLAIPRINSPKADVKSAEFGFPMLLRLIISCSYPLQLPIRASVN